MIGLDRRGAATGDVLIGLALLVLIAALLYPTLRARSVEAGLADAIADVEALRTAAVERRRETGRWPTPAPPGAVPPELGAALAGDTSLLRVGYALEWGRWDVVDLVPAPPSSEPTADAPPDSVGPPLMPVVRRVGSVAVHSADETLLSELLSRYSDQGAFVRDTIWTLVLGEGAGGP